MVLGISLANKCQLLFGFAVVVILSAVLAVPWQTGDLGGCNSHDRLDAAIDVVVGGRPRTDGDAHGGTPVPDRAATPASPFFLDGGYDLVGTLFVAKRDQNLIQHNLVQDLEPGA